MSIAYRPSVSKKVFRGNVSASIIFRVFIRVSVSRLFRLLIGRVRPLFNSSGGSSPQVFFRTVSRVVTSERKITLCLTMCFGFFSIGAIGSVIYAGPRGTFAILRGYPGTIIQWSIFRLVAPRIMNVYKGRKWGRARWG